MCILSVYTLLKVVGYYDFIVLSKSVMGGFYPIFWGDFWNFYNFAKPLKAARFRHFLVDVLSLSSCSWCCPFTYAFLSFFPSHPSLSLLYWLSDIFFFSSDYTSIYCIFLSISATFVGPLILVFLFISSFLTALNHLMSTISNFFSWAFFIFHVLTPCIIASLAMS